MKIEFHNLESMIVKMASKFCFDIVKFENQMKTY